MSEPLWSDPGIYPVLDGVYRIPLPLPNDGLRAVNVYAIQDGDGLVVIDSGWALAESQAQLERGLAEIDHKISDIRQFLVTHVHQDHYAQAIAIRRVFGTKVAIGEYERPALEQLIDPDRAAGGRGMQRLVRSGAQDLLDQIAPLWASNPYLDPTKWELPDWWLSAGELPLQSRVLDVVPTPGHTAGHIVFHDRAAAALFAGDHVLSQITPSIGLEPVDARLPLGAYMDSLTLMLTMPDALLLPAHGPVAPSVHTRVEELLAHHERRLTESSAAVDTGADTAALVAAILRWTRRERHFSDLDLYNQTLAVGETLAHLDVCVARGWLRTTTDEAGVSHFARA
jgi:glyoxylase-like metal-dependent hydrolase (beta-lactamase superfamily II)